MADVGVFPTLPGLAWSVVKTPTFQTRIQRAASGRELRALDYPFPLWQFSLTFEFLRDDAAAGLTELHTLMGFFLACQGAFGGFLFSDPTDNAVTGQVIGVGNGSATVFQLVRSLGQFVEPITAPHAISAVYLNGGVNAANPVSTDVATGLITFQTAPANGVSITADFTYYFRCRFVDDSSAFENFMHNLWTLKKLNFISVRP